MAEGTANYKIGKFTLDIPDVTGDSTPDFVCSGTIRPTTTSAAGYTKGRVVKAGVGTLGIEGPFIMTNTATRIEAGTFLVNGNCLAANLPCHFVLAGGTFAVAAGSTNTCGTLNVESGSSLSVPADALLSFAESSGVDWTSDVEVSVNADLSADAVRFGTDASGLTVSQARRLKNGGRPCYLDENGYLRQKPLLGLMLLVK